MGTWLVTGGAGFIGCNFVRLALAETGARVVVLDKLTYAGSLENLSDVLGNPRLELIQGDIADRAAVRRLFAEHRPLAVLNFAPPKATSTAPSTTRAPSSRPTSWAPSSCWKRRAAISRA